jgi:hypothetical protein
MQSFVRTQVLIPLTVGEPIEPKSSNRALKHTQWRNPGEYDIAATGFEAGNPADLEVLNLISGHRLKH